MPYPNPPGSYGWGNPMESTRSPFGSFAKGWALLGITVLLSPFIKMDSYSTGWPEGTPGR